MTSPGAIPEAAAALPLIYFNYNGFDRRLGRSYSFLSFVLQSDILKPKLKGAFGPYKTSHFEPKF